MIVKLELNKMQAGGVGGMIALHNSREESPGSIGQGAG